jgi:hypothetical protein
MSELSERLHQFIAKEFAHSLERQSTVAPLSTEADSAK